MILALRIFLVLGMLVALYTWRVKIKGEEKKKYNPVCDINDRVSCTKAVNSKYGSLLKILPNHVLGLLFYVSAFAISFTSYDGLIFFMTIPAIIMTLVLAYISVFIQKNFCVVCICSYIVNIAVLILSYRLYF